MKGELIKMAKAHLLFLERRPQTDQQRIVGEFLARVGDVENFVILAQTKDGKMAFFPCVSADPDFAVFIDLCKAKLVEHAAAQFGGQTGEARLTG